MRRPFLTLGIESSCDDTALCVLSGQREVLASALSSQIDIHASFGGVVPEVASREHQAAILPLLEHVLEKAGVRNPPRDLGLVAVTSGPGLMGSLLVGTMTAKALSQAWELPLVGVNHLEGHLFANIVAHEDLEPPFLCLIVSGGHSEVILVRSLGDYVLLGETRDDAVGECYDKVAKLLGLPYPGGPVIDRLAASGDPHSFAFPRPMADTDRVEFSFSGLKTAVLWAVKRLEARKEELSVEDLCASFQRAAVDVLMKKVELAVKQTGVRKVALSGGVAANSYLRERMENSESWTSFIPPRSLCTDNAVMIAAAGYNNWRRSIRSPLSLVPDPSWMLAQHAR
jgi:N6-L-threonylcarbamoyladenine synthase